MRVQLVPGRFPPSSRGLGMRLAHSYTFPLLQCILQTYTEMLYPTLTDMEVHLHICLTISSNPLTLVLLAIVNVIIITNLANSALS